MEPTVEPGVLDLFGSFIVMGVIYICSSWVRNWVKQLNEYDQFSQQPKYSTGLRWTYFFLFWFVSFSLFLGGKTLLGKFFNIDSWIILPM